MTEAGVLVGKKDDDDDDDLSGMEPQQCGSRAQTQEVVNDRDRPLVSNADQEEGGETVESDWNDRYELVVFRFSSSDPITPESLDGVILERGLIDEEQPVLASASSSENETKGQPQTRTLMLAPFKEDVDRLSLLVPQSKGANDNSNSNNNKTNEKLTLFRPPIRHCYRVLPSRPSPPEPRATVTVTATPVEGILSSSLPPNPHLRVAYAPVAQKTGLRRRYRPIGSHGKTVVAPPPPPSAETVVHVGEPEERSDNKEPQEENDSATPAPDKTFPSKKKQKHKHKSTTSAPTSTPKREEFESLPDGPTSTTTPTETDTERMKDTDAVMEDREEATVDSPVVPEKETLKKMKKEERKKHKKAKKLKKEKRKRESLM